MENKIDRNLKDFKKYGNNIYEQWRRGLSIETYEKALLKTEAAIMS